LPGLLDPDSNLRKMLGLESSSKDTNIVQKQLKLKIERIMETISTLQKKKVHLELEMQRQKAALSNKRGELKKAHTATREGYQLTLEAKVPDEQLQEALKSELLANQKLLSESARMLESS